MKPRLRALLMVCGMLGVFLAFVAGAVLGYVGVSHGFSVNVPVCGIGGGEKAPDDFGFARGAASVSNAFEDVASDQRARFGRIMGRASDAHGLDRSASKRFGVASASSAIEISAFATQSTFGPTAQDDIRMLFEIATASIPIP